MRNGFKVDIPDERTFVVWAGPNGSGKTMAKRLFLKADFPYIDPDAIQRDLNTPVILVASSHTSQQIIAYLENDKQTSFGLETTLAAKRPEGLVKLANIHNYKVVLWYFVPSDVDVCINNVHTRVAQNGHDVPEDTIRTRYASSLENFSRMCKHVDDWHLVFNDGQDYTLVAQSVNGNSECIAPDVVPLLPQELQSVLPQLIPTMCH